VSTKLQARTESDASALRREVQALREEMARLKQEKQGSYTKNTYIYVQHITIQYNAYSMSNAHLSSIEQLATFTRQRGELQLIQEERTALISQLETARTQWQEASKQLNVCEDERTTQQQRILSMEQELKRLSMAKYALVGHYFLI